MGIERHQSARGALSVEEFAAWAGIGRTAAFEEIRSGRLIAHKCGRRTIIPIWEAQRWLAALPVANKETAAPQISQMAHQSG